MNYKNLIPENIDDRIRMDMTCSACPEQYDMFYNNKNMGFLHFRHGSYIVYEPVENTYDEYGNVNHPKILYRANPDGDGLFREDQREFFLTMGKLAVLENLGVIELEQDIPTSMEELTHISDIQDTPLIKF